MEFVIAIVALAGLVWGGLVLTRGGLLAGTLLVLLAGSCFGHTFWNVRAGAMSVTIDRLLLVVVVLQAIWYWRAGRLQWRRSPGADYLVLALLGWLTASTLVHDWTRDKGLPLAHLIVFYALPATLYWLARQVPLTERHLRWLLGSLTAFGVYLAVTAIAERQGWWGLVWPPYVGSPKFVEFYGRARGPFLNPVGCGLFQTVCLAAALLVWPHCGRAGRALLAGAAIPLLLVGIYCTLTRSVWIGAAAMLLVVGGLALPRHWRAPTLLAAGAIGAAVVAASWNELVAFQRDKGLSARETEESVRLRPILATIAWHMFLDRPLAGCGFGQYPLVSREYTSDRSTDLPLEKARPYVQHNTFLALLTETGLVGMGLFVALLAVWTRAAWRLWRSQVATSELRQAGLLFLTLLAAYLPNAMFHDLAIVAMVNSLLFFLGGLSLTAALHGQPTLAALPARGGEAASGAFWPARQPLGG